MPIVLIRSCRVEESSWPQVTLLSDTHVLRARDGVADGLPTHSSSRDPATAILNSKTVSTVNSQSGTPPEGRLFFCGYRRVLVLFFACQKTETMSNIVDTWWCSGIPSRIFWLLHIPPGRRPPAFLSTFYFTCFVFFLFLSFSC